MTSLVVVELMLHVLGKVPLRALHQDHHPGGLLDFTVYSETVPTCPACVPDLLHIWEPKGSMLNVFQINISLGIGRLGFHLN